MQRILPTASFAAMTMMAILSAPALGAPDITVEFAKRIEKRLDAIDRVERIREERFRRTLVDEPSPFQTIQGRLNQEFRNVRWAGEMLVPDLESFGMRPLITAMVAHNLARAVPDFDGSVRLEIKRFKVRDHSVAYLRSDNSYVTGEIEVRDASGSLIFSDRLTANFVLDPSVDSNYQGPRLAFAETDEDDRIGPTLAYFVERALERAWPDKKDEIVGPTIIRLTGPNETILR